ncbi:hypothetical protein [Janthinobacterium psychrotolerans]|uniref:hypothetical protein n=1 Tax=Janthinobacterium psychrotolerans TaxID=1747903 RepID=UPI0012374332|nr:hypothetical protein [Janthinobacterium psychrotolerans]
MNLRDNSRKPWQTALGRTAARPVLSHGRATFSAFSSRAMIGMSVDLPQIPRFFQVSGGLLRRKHDARMEPAAIRGVYLFA